MRSTFYFTVIVNLIIFTLINVVEETRFAPKPEKVHFGHMTYPRRWGRWCSEDNECGLGFCSAYMCQCYRGYITWYFMDTCAYEQRTKLTAFLVSFFVGMLGVDWFVLSRGNAGYIVVGIIKLLISLGCCTAWPLLLIARAKSRKYVAIGNIINIIISAISLIWWSTDWIRILANVFYDGNGAPLQPWDYDYYYYNNNRIRYRA